DYIATAYHCIAVVGNEGGAINIAKVLKKPTFAVFSPLINPSGWHSENRNTCLAVNLKEFYPQAIDYSKHQKISKDPTKVEELYKMLRPELFKKQWIDFLNRLVSD
ncbi:MAG: lipopolysaccharide heptosyltransferase family protein, partial [Bacteroidota bacterium]|nr:lipopolysaccharide heptosyltransferase family protein [Bacteroidota bacterium]